MEKKTGTALHALAGHAMKGEARRAHAPKPDLLSGIVPHLNCMYIYIYV